MVAAQDQGEASPPTGEVLNEISISEALTIALSAQKSGELHTAAEIYQRILTAVPDQPDALHFLGMLYWAVGQREPAIALVERSVAVAPDMTDWRNNLGNLYLRTGREGEARALYRGVIEEKPEHVNAWANLGIAERSLGAKEEAEQAFRQALMLDPDHADAHANLAAFLSANKRIKESMEHLFRAIALNPRHADGSRILLSRAYVALGEPEKAIEVLREWLAVEPDDPVPRHYLAAMTGEDVPARAEDRYVETVFDNFASHFDQSLAKLDYRAPELIANALTRAVGDASGQRSGLDAGCGTGLLGPLIAPHFLRLDGVDLSAKMLEKAAPRGVYTALRHAELTADILAHPATYDVILSADTLCYFGALEQVLAACRDALKPGGVLIFSLEREMSAEDGPGFRLQAHGRYCHREAYVTSALAGAGFAVEAVLRDVLRQEAGMPVAGLVFTARLV